MPASNIPAWRINAARLLRGGVIASSLLLSGCATVVINDSGQQDDGSRGTFFVVTAIDGKTIANSLAATRQSSYGQGFALSAYFVSRLVPVRPMRLRLVGTHQTAAPIHEMVARMAGTFQSVQGEVAFNPVEDAIYRVTGTLDPKQSCVWVEEERSQAVVTERVCTRPESEP
jgi:hypothetical protein